MSIFSRKKIFTFKGSSGGSSLSGLTTNYLTKATSASTIGDSVVYEGGGNVGIGLTTLGAKLHVKGSDATSSNYAFKADNSASSPLFYVRNDGLVELGANIDTGVRVSTNATNSYNGKKFQIEVGGGQWGLGFSSAQNALTLLTTGSVNGNFIFGSGTEVSPSPRFYYNSTYGGLAVNVALGSISAVGHFKMPSAGNATDSILKTETFGGVTNFIVRNDGNVGINSTSPTSKLQVVGLSTYADNAAAVTAGLTAGAFYIRTGHGLDVVV